MACQVGSVSLVKCGVQSAQCSGELKGPPSVSEWTFGNVEEATQCAVKVQDDR